jgi:hypothetical protein
MSLTERKRERDPFLMIMQEEKCFGSRAPAIPSILKNSYFSMFQKNMKINLDIAIDVTHGHANF